MKFLLQHNFFTERNFILFRESLDRLKLEYDIIEYNNDQISLIDPDQYAKNTFCFGSVKFANDAARYNWYPGSFSNDQHDYKIYSKYYREHLLNYVGIYSDIREKLPEKVPTMFFARPSKDTKLFTGQVFMEHSWYDFIDGIIATGRVNDHNNEILFSSLKNIKREIRCWIVMDKVISISQYRIDNKTIFENLDSNEYIKNIVNNFVSIYSPANAYVMDICELENGEYKIVEINCINCSGLYDGNVDNIITALCQNFTI